MTTLPSPTPLPKPEHCGPYLLEARLAVGGMGEVFRARRLGVASFARLVCVKRMHPHLCDEPDLVARFVDEARLGARLRHKNLVAVEDLGIHEGRHYLAMEYVHGRDLLAMRKRATALGVRVPAEIGMFVAFEALSALHALHTAKDPDTRAPLGVVHRDVTPHNIMVSFAGQLKLTDYGVARAAGRRIDTMGRTPCGKPSYMPVEQASGAGVSPRSDLFALGVTLFELLTGTRPYAADKPRPTLMEIVAAQLRNDRVSLGTLRPDLPAAFVAVVDAMLEPSASARIASADEARARIAPWISGLDGPRVMVGWLSLLWPDEPSLQIPSPLDDDPHDTIPDAVLHGAEHPISPTVSLAGTAADRTTRANSPRGSRTPARWKPSAVWLVALGVATMQPVPVARAASQLALTVAPPPRARMVTSAFGASRHRHEQVIEPERSPIKTPEVRRASRSIEPRNGVLRVVGLPWGDATIDGQPWGATPITTHVRPGVHHVVVDGPRHLERTVRVGEAQTVAVVLDAD